MVAPFSLWTLSTWAPCILSLCWAITLRSFLTSLAGMKGEKLAVRAVYGKTAVMFGNASVWGTKTERAGETEKNPSYKDYIIFNIKYCMFTSQFDPNFQNDLIHLHFVLMLIIHFKQAPDALTKETSPEMGRATNKSFLFPLSCFFRKLPTLPESL